MRHLATLLVALLATQCLRAQTYVPTPENIASRQEFSQTRLGIFLHWGIYSSFAQGEWYMQNAGLPLEEYAKAADAFYPHRFDARQWVRAIHDSGAGYVCLTSRHHDGFSMWDTDQSQYNIVDATPFGRDVVGEMAQACHEEGIRLHLYYSHLDWGRADYPMGRTGRNCGKDTTQANWPHYYAFMNAQLTELLTRYGKIGAIWFDGWWDHDSDATPFDWQLEEQYALIHRLQPGCLVGNNHHMNPYPGEDIQIFERDLPGENTAGFVDEAAEVSQLPLETCQTMNGMWGYKVVDQDYKSTRELIHYLVKTAGRGANLLLNIGPQPNGELPATALSRLQEMGQWMRAYGSTINGTQRGDILPQEWGATTRRGDELFIHVLQDDAQSITLPPSIKVKHLHAYDNGNPVPYQRTASGTVIPLPDHHGRTDYILVAKTK